MNNPRTLHIRQRMPGLNELIALAKSHPKAYAREKKKWAHVIGLYALEQKFPVIDEPAHFEFEYLEPNRRRDPDNLTGARKFCLDALQDAGLLANDGWENILSFCETWKVDKQPGVRLTVR